VTPVEATPASPLRRNEKDGVTVKEMRGISQGGVLKPAVAR
jgi:hypothetical protein